LLVPEHVIERLASIGDYEQDASARGRLIAWGVAFRMIGDFPFFGVGPRNFLVHFAEYIEGPISWAPVAHNSYLQIWAEGGTVAIIIFLWLLGSAFWTLRGLQRATRGDAELHWARDYARMIEASLVGFIIGGMFLNRGHFDLVYHLIAIVTALRAVTIGLLQREEPSWEERPTITVARRSARGAGATPVFAAPKSRLHGWGS
jgi:O-antigen ligase